MAGNPPSAGTGKRRPRKGRVRDAYGKRIKALARRGHGIAAISKRLGQDPATVRKILSAAGLLKLRGTHPTREKVLPLVEGGLTLTGAAQALGVNANVARYHYKKAGGKARRPGAAWSGSPRRAAELLERLEAHRRRTGITWKEVASRCGLSAGPFSGWRTGKRVPSDYTLNKVEGFLSKKKG